MSEFHKSLISLYIPEIAILSVFLLFRIDFGDFNRKNSNTITQLSYRMTKLK